MWHCILLNLHSIYSNNYNVATLLTNSKLSKPNLIDRHQSNKFAIPKFLFLSVCVSV